MESKLHMRAPHMAYRECGPLITKREYSRHDFSLGKGRVQGCSQSYAAPGDEEGFRHLICGPNQSDEVSPRFHSYAHETYQQIAVLGIVVTILGLRPRKNPIYPLRLLMIEAASYKPRTLRSSASAAVPLVCSKVLITSRGVVIPAANPPATPPAMQCVTGSYCPEGFMNLDIDS